MVPKIAHEKVPFNPHNSEHTSWDAEMSQQGESKVEVGRWTEWVAHGSFA
jgi:hypothetical protein